MPPPGPVVPFLLCSKAAAGEILRSLARRRRVPSSITTYRWPVTRLSSAGWGGRGEGRVASAAVPAAAHRPGLPEVRFARASRAKCCGCTGAFQALRAGSIPVARSDSEHHGEWRSLVAHPAGGRAVAGSNPVSPIEGKGPLCGPFALVERRYRPGRPVQIASKFLADHCRLRVKTAPGEATNAAALHRSGRCLAGWRARQPKRGNRPRLRRRREGLRASAPGTHSRPRRRVRARTSHSPASARTLIVQRHAAMAAVTPRAFSAMAATSTLDRGMSSNDPVWWLNAQRMSAGARPGTAPSGCARTARPPRADQSRRSSHPRPRRRGRGR